MNKLLEFFSRRTIRTDRLTLQEQLFLMKRLSFLMGADLPLRDCIVMLQDQSSSPAFTHILTRVLSDIERGRSLAYSFSHFPQTFDALTLNILRVGESSASLSQSLEYLAEDLRKRHLLRNKMRSAFVYPLVITIATFAITGFLVLYLFPRIMPVFLSLHMQLPLTTRIVMALSSFLMHWWLVCIIVALLSVATLRTYLAKSESAQVKVERYLLALPYLAPLVRRYNLAITFRTLGLLLKSGITLDQGLVLASTATNNRTYRTAYQELSRAVERGERISDRISDLPRLFPSVSVQMIAVGERSGTLSRTLLYVSDLYATELEESIATLSTLIEPALMVVMGLIVGFIAVSIITPIYGITQSLHG